MNSPTSPSRCALPWTPAPAWRPVPGDSRHDQRSHRRSPRPPPPPPPPPPDRAAPPRHPRAPPPPTPPASPPPTHAQIEIRSPATGEPVGSVRACTPGEVREATARARQAQESWAQLSVKERASRLRTYHRAIHTRLDEIISVLCNEGGK